MNGYEMLAASYRALAAKNEITQKEAEKKCKVLDFLATCDDEDICNLFDSSAFNEIMMSYIRKALQRIDELTDEQQMALRNELRMLLSEKTASEII